MIDRRLHVLRMVASCGTVTGAALMEDPLDLLVPRTHLLAGASGAEMTKLADTAHYASTWDTGAALVAAGLGIALIPRMANVPAGHPVVRIPLVGQAAPERHVLTGIRRGECGFTTHLLGSCCAAPGCRAAKR
jgi:hypothetical protein